MKTKAAILFHLKNKLQVEEIEIPPLQDGQVLVKIHFSGICHTQILEIDGKRGEDPFLPHCLGHEGSGEVVEIGKGVEKTKPGDKVILSWIKGKGGNVSSTKYRWKGREINSGAIATFNEYAVISENRVTVLPKERDINLLQAALIGCAIPTGVGTVLNTAKPKENESIAVFGCGGIGLWAIQAARLQKCHPIFAIDIYDHKLQLAQKLGATVLINAKKQDPTKEIQRYGLLDYAVEASGCEKVMQGTLDVIRPQGGKSIIIGNASFGSSLRIDPRKLNQGKSILGSWGGESNPDSDYLKFYSLMKKKKLFSEEFTKKIYPLEDINVAIDDLKGGRGIRPIIQMDL